MFYASFDQVNEMLLGFTVKYFNMYTCNDNKGENYYLYLQNVLVILMLGNFIGWGLKRSNLVGSE